MAVTFCVVCITSRQMVQEFVRRCCPLLVRRCCPLLAPDAGRSCFIAVSKASESAYVMTGCGGVGAGGGGGGSEGLEGEGLLKKRTRTTYILMNSKHAAPIPERMTTLSLIFMAETLAG